MSSIRSLGLLAALPALAAAATTNVGSGIIRHGITAKEAPVRDWFKRQSDDVSVQQRRTGTLYTVDIEIGTPGQPVTVLIDTGSDELWINPDCSTAGSDTNEAFCNTLPRFDPAKSSSVNNTGEKGQITYGRGQVSFDYLADQVSIGAGTLDGQIFGAATSSNDVPIGIIGLAPPLDGGDAPYPLVLDSFVSQGLIKSRAFSLDLRSIDSPDGSVIFGGIDTGKFSGPLAKFPIVDLTQSKGDRYWINLDYVGMTLEDGSVKDFHNDSFAVFLDSGGSLSRLPTSIYTAVGNAFPNSQFDPQSRYYVVDCSIADTDGSVDFRFGDKTIRVDYKDFIWHVPDTEYCVVGLLPDDEDPVLGDSFLRAAYVVYDQDNRNLHLAQADNCGQNLVAIGSGPNAVPSVTGDCGASKPNSTATATPTKVPTGTGSLPTTAVPTGSVPYPSSNGTYTTGSSSSYPAGSSQATASPTGGYSTGGSQATASPTGDSPTGGSQASTPSGGYPASGSQATPSSGYPTSGSQATPSSYPAGSSQATASPTGGYPTGGSQATASPTGGSPGGGHGSPTGGYPTAVPTPITSARPTHASTYVVTSVYTSDDCETTDYVTLTSTCTEEEATPTTTPAPTTAPPKPTKPTYTTSYKVTKTYTVSPGVVTTKVVTTTTTWCPEVPIVTIPILASIPIGGPGGRAHPTPTGGAPSTEATPTGSGYPSSSPPPASQAPSAPPASYPTASPPVPAPYPTTTLATSPIPVGTVGSTAVRGTSYPTSPPVQTAGAGKTRVGGLAGLMLAAVAAWAM